MPLNLNKVIFMAKKKKKEKEKGKKVLDNILGISVRYEGHTVVTHQKAQNVIIIFSTTAHVSLSESTDLMCEHFRHFRSLLSTLSV